jgi:hypothetical protein
MAWRTVRFSKQWKDNGTFWSLDRDWMACGTVEFWRQWKDNEHSDHWIMTGRHQCLVNGYSIHTESVSYLQNFAKLYVILQYDNCRTRIFNDIFACLRRVCRVDTNSNTPLTKKIAFHTILCLMVLCFLVQDSTHSREKSQPTLYRKSWVFSGCSGFLPQEMLTGWVGIIPPNWPFHRSCAPWSDMSHNVAVPEALLESLRLDQVELRPSHFTWQKSLQYQQWAIRVN